MVNTALERGRMLSFAYVDPEGRPALSFRGSLQTHGDSQLAIWVRNPEGGLLKAVRAGHVHVVALYGQLTPEKAFITFRGRARIDNSDAARRAVYQSAPKLEQDLDKEQRGVALIIDLDSVDGLLGGQLLRMRR